MRNFPLHRELKQPAGIPVSATIHRRKALTNDRVNNPQLDMDNLPHVRIAWGPSLEQSGYPHRPLPGLASIYPRRGGAAPNTLLVDIPCYQAADLWSEVTAEGPADSQSVPRSERAAQGGQSPPPRSDTEDALNRSARPDKLRMYSVQALTEPRTASTD